MSEFFGKSLRDVLKVAASSEPAPGGGSIAAIGVAFAASMSAMVTNLTIGKKKYKDVEDQMIDLRERAMGLISKAEELVDADMSAFTRFMDAYKMPRTTDEEKEKRSRIVQEALKVATETPLDIARAALEVLKMVDEIAPIGSSMAISDAGVSCYLADASLRAALLNVDINLPQVKDTEFVAYATGEKENLLAQAQEIKERSMAIIADRL